MISHKDKRFFICASKIAELSTYNKQHIGCVIVYKNRIISTGCNKNKTSPIQKKYNNERNIPDYSPHKIHAETDAITHIIDLDIDWSKVSMYIYRSRKDQPFGLARPCKSCMKLIQDIGIRNIYYTTNEGYANEIIIK